MRTIGGSRRKGSVAILLALLTSASIVGVQAARAESLLDAVADAYRYNPRLDAERARLRATDEEIARAHSGYRPQVNLDADFARERQEVRPDLGQSGNSSPRGYSVQLVQPVFRGFQTMNAVSEAESLSRAGRETLRSVEQDVLQTAVQSYGDVVRDQAIVRLRENNLEFLSQELKATQDRFAVGEVPRYRWCNYATHSVVFGINLIMQGILRLLGF